MERDWAIVKLENFSLEMAALQFQPGIDYSAPPPDSGMYIYGHSGLLWNHLFWWKMEVILLDLLDLSNHGVYVTFASRLSSTDWFQPRYRNSSHADAFLKECVHVCADCPGSGCRWRI